MTKFVRIYMPDGSRLKIESEKYEVENGTIKVFGIGTGGVPVVTIPAGNWLRAETHLVNVVIE